jgi:protein-disulfide isomerase
MNLSPTLHKPTLAAVVAAVAMLVIGYIGAPTAAAVRPAIAPNNVVAAKDLVNSAQVSSANDPTIGNPNAPLTIVYWFDYQCRFCRENEQNTMPQIIQNYVDSGKVKIVFKDFAFLGPDSDALGRYGRAVWAVAPSRFYQWHKAVYENQGEENSAWATTAEIRKITASVLTPVQTSDVMRVAVANAIRYQKAMDADKKEGALLGVHGTPAMLIDNQMVTGYTPYMQMKAIVDAQLAGKRQEIQSLSARLGGKDTRRWRRNQRADQTPAPASARMRSSSLASSEARQ